MENNEVYELTLDDAIQTGLQRVVNSDSTEEFCDNAKAVKELYSVEVEEQKVKNDYYAKSTELANKSQELDQQTQLKNRINPNTVLTVGVGAALTIGTMIYEHEGRLFRLNDIGKLMLGLITKNK